MKRKPNFLIPFKDYILRFFPCTCAGYYKDKNKKDPDCFSCAHSKTLLKMLIDVRGASIAETQRITITSARILDGDILFVPEPFQKIHLDAIWSSNTYKLTKKVIKKLHDYRGNSEDLQDVEVFR